MRDKVSNSENRMREDMSEDNNRTPADKRKRVQKLKKLIMLTLIISIVIPWICCAVLLVKVQGISETLQITINRLDEMNGLFLEQQGLLKGLTAETNTEGEGSLPVKEAARDTIPNNDMAENGSGQDVSGILKEEATHKVYLTFDDGPSIYTEDILDILDQYDIKATFFAVGKEGETSREALRQIVDRGHTLGMHSYSHVYREIYESVDCFTDDFAKIQNYLYEVTGVKSTIYRFPGGSSNKVSDVDMQEFADYLQTEGVTFYDWNISSGDASSRLLSVQELVDNCTKDVGTLKTSIILLHDSADKRTTVEALPMIIENILAMEDTVILPITEDTEPVQHIKVMYTKATE